MTRSALLRHLDEQLREIEAGAEELVRRRSSHPGPAPSDEDEDDGRSALLPPDVRNHNP